LKPHLESLSLFVFCLICFSLFVLLLGGGGMFVAVVVMKIKMMTNADFTGNDRHNKKILRFLADLLQIPLRSPRREEGTRQIKVKPSRVLEMIGLSVVTNPEGWC
jgi:hypothetical protein